jgi:hypothetical protein
MQLSLSRVKHGDQEYSTGGKLQFSLRKSRTPRSPSLKHNFQQIATVFPWYLSTSNLHLQVLRLRRQVSTTGARQAMMGKQPDRKASFSCHNLISDIFQSTINYQLNGRSWNLKTFRLSFVRSPATTPQVALPLQTRSAMPTYPGAQYQPQPDAFGRPILDLSRNIH